MRAQPQHGCCLVSTSGAHKRSCHLKSSSSTTYKVQMVWLNTRILFSLVFENVTNRRNYSLMVNLYIFDFALFIIIIIICQQQRLIGQHDKNFSPLRTLFVIKHDISTAKLAWSRLTPHPLLTPLLI